MRILAIAAMVSALPAAAQWRHFGYEEGRPTGYFGIGFAAPVNPLAGALDTGWNFAGGVGFTRDYTGLMLNVTFADFGFNDAALRAQGARHGSQQFWAVTLDPVFHVNERGPVDFYLTGGGGLYSVRTNYRTSANFFPATANYELTATNWVHKPGLDGGAGFSFTLDPASRLKFFMEARYHYVYLGRSGMSFIPVTVGVRF